MKKVLVLLLLVCLVLPVVAYAGSPHEEVTAYFWYIPAGDCEAKIAGNNFIGRNCTDEGTYGELMSGEKHGDFLGTSNEVYELVLHGIDPLASPPFFDFAKKGWYKGIVTFDGTIFPETDKEKSGIMYIKYIGTSLPGEFVWSGTWRILGGEGELEGIHGGGTWQGSTIAGYAVELEGKIHFSPH